MSKYARRDLEQTFLIRNRDICIFIVLILFSIISLLLFQNIKRGVVISPINTVQKGFYQLTQSIKELGFNAQYTARLENEHAALLRVINAYEYAVNERENLLQTIDELKTILAFSNTLTFENIVAEIVANDPNSAYLSYTINKGRRHGIDVDMPVVAFQDGEIGLVGSVATASSTSAVIKPITESSSYIISEHENSNVAGILQGITDNERVLSLTFTSLREYEAIREGDRIVTSRLSSLYPADIPVGHISKIVLDNLSETITVQIVPILNFNRLRYVFVLIPAKLFEG